MFSDDCHNAAGYCTIEIKWRLKPRLVYYSLALDLSFELSVKEFCILDRVLLFSLNSWIRNMFPSATILGGGVASFKQRPWGRLIWLPWDRIKASLILLMSFLNIFTLSLTCYHVRHKKLSAGATWCWSSQPPARDKRTFTVNCSCCGNHHDINTTLRQYMKFKILYCLTANTF